RGAGDEDGRRGAASTNGAHGTNGHHEAPASGPIAVNGRHAWPGAPAADENVDGSDSTDGTEPAARPRRAAHAAPADAPSAGTDAPAPDAAVNAPDLSGDGHTTIEHAPEPGAGPPRRGLIHPIVVPPPAPVPADGGVPADVSGPLPAAPAPRRSEEDEPAPVGPNGLVLARRRPQSHLAPELIRPAPATPAASTPNGGSHRRPGTPAADRGAMDALSAYQASRAAARSAIGADGSGGSPAPTDPSRQDHHPYRGTTTGSQT
ncbi:MAG TPA: hypothetical protein VNP37_14775, partial [Actinomycetospora sp.]|nr:hypothetical protein [Actinomycetospora sp.]